MDISRPGLKATVFSLFAFFTEVSADETLTVNKSVEININAPTSIRVPIPKSCTIDLKNKSKVTVRVLGSKKVFYYPLVRPTGRDPQIMALEEGVARELLEAPFYRAYAVPKYGIGYGYDGAGLLVYSGLLIENCPMPTPVTGLFMPVKLVSPYVNRDFLARYFSVLDEE
jgi:hypothetical protein